MAFRFCVSALLLVAITACGRSGLDEDQAEQLAQATDDSSAALEQANTNAGAIEELDGRVDTLEEGGGSGSVTDDIADLNAGLTDTQEDLQDLDVRVGALEGMHPVTDDAVVVDDREAAGFPLAAPIDNAEDGFAYVNQRITVVDGRVDTFNENLAAVAGAIDSLEVSFGSNLESTVVNVINQEVGAGNITVQTDLSFTAAPDVDPRDNTFGVVEYSAATNYEEAIRALRYANQSKYVPKTANTRLGALTRNYVQEAIDVLDTDVYDVIYGNLAIDLNAGATVDGTALDVYLASVVETDTTLLTNIFNTTYFEDAVTNVITGGGAGPGVTAADVSVDATNLGAPADYADVQVSLETLYARLGDVEADVAQNAADIATNTANIATNTTNIATNTGAIAINTTNIATNTGNITTLQGDVTTLQTNITTLTTQVQNAAAADVSFDNTAHAPFDGTNNTANVQIAVEDLHEQATRLTDALNAIAAGGGTCEDNTTACTADVDCAGIGGGTCQFAVTDAANVIYDNASYPTVDLALDYLFTQIVQVSAMVGDGNYYSDGDDVRLAVEIIDGVLFDLGLDVDAAEVAIADLDARLSTVEAQVATNTAAIATNTANIATNTGEIANHAADIAVLQATVATDTAALQASIDANTANIATNAANIATNATEIADLDGRVAALETFNTTQLDTRIQNLVDASIQQLIDDRIVDIEARLDAVETAQADFTGHSFILGLSAQSSSGRFEFGGETGVRAATAMCQATYAAEANAHLCTVPEVQQAVALGNYDDGSTFTGTATWTQTGLSRRHNTIDAFTNADSRTTSCLDFLYNSGDVATGTQLTVLLNEPSFGAGGAGIAGDMVSIVPNRGCNQVRQVLCCR